MYAPYGNMRRAFTVAIVIGLSALCVQLEAQQAQLDPALIVVRPPPSWVLVDVPAEYRGYVGKDGLPDPYPSWKHPIGVGTQNIDFWQANHFLAYRPETAKFLYAEYTPTVVHYKKGALPEFERLVDKHLSEMTNPRDKAILLLREVVPRLMIHPGMAPVGPSIPTDRGLLDQELLASERGFCNEQARVFVRLCQVADIPARLIFLFYNNKKTGHVVAEFYADGRWSMADASYFCVFPAADGHLMSAAECHGEGRKAAAETYHRRYQQLIAMSDQELAGAKHADLRDESRRAKAIARTADDIRRQLGPHTSASIADTLWAFGVLNYPLPLGPDE